MDLSLLVKSSEAMTAFAETVGPGLVAGDVLLLDGVVGAGKTHFARSLIQDRLQEIGIIEDIPSPTFTLVQVYELGSVDIWHSDLYRLSAPEEAIELGLEDAFQNAICLVEWPDRLGTLSPENALTISISLADGDQRLLHLTGADRKWNKLTAPLGTLTAEREDIHVR